jgi:hypothetical protein
MTHPGHSDSIRRPSWGRGRGETNGVILDDGTVVRFPPHVGQAFATLVVPGARLVAQSCGASGPAGTAIEAVALESSESSLMSVGPGRPRPQLAATLATPAQALREECDAGSPNLGTPVPLQPGPSTEGCASELVTPPAGRAAVQTRD